MPLKRLSRQGQRETATGGELPFVTSAQHPIHVSRIDMFVIGEPREHVTGPSRYPAAASFGRK